MNSLSGLKKIFFFLIRILIAYWVSVCFETVSLVTTWADAVECHGIIRCFQIERKQHHFIFVQANLSVMVQALVQAEKEIQMWNIYRQRTQNDGK
jgi:hypothetical protein